MSPAFSFAKVIINRAFHGSQHYCNPFRGTLNIVALYIDIQSITY